MRQPKTGLSLLAEWAAAFVNAVEQFGRWMWGLHEVRPDPYYLSRYRAWGTDTQPGQTWGMRAEPAESVAPEVSPELVAGAWFPPAPVSLVKAPSLVRPFVRLHANQPVLAAKVGPLKPTSLESWRGHPRMIAARLAPLIAPKVDLLKHVVRETAQNTAEAGARFATAVGRAAAPVDELGLPLNMELGSEGIGFFEQTMDAWRLRTGRTVDVSWT